MSGSYQSTNGSGERSHYGQYSTTESNHHGSYATRDRQQTYYINRSDGSSHYHDPRTSSQRDGGNANHSRSSTNYNVTTSPQRSEQSSRYRHEGSSHNTGGGLSPMDRFRTERASEASWNAVRSFTGLGGGHRASGSARPNGVGYHPTSAARSTRTERGSGSR